VCYIFLFWVQSYYMYVGLFSFHCLCTSTKWSYSRKDNLWTFRTGMVSSEWFKITYRKSTKKYRFLGKSAWDLRPYICVWKSVQSSYKITVTLYYIIKGSFVCSCGFHANFPNVHFKEEIRVAQLMCATIIKFVLFMYFFARPSQRNCSL
jgi:hypothetical protein